MHARAHTHNGCLPTGAAVSIPEQPVLGVHRDKGHQDENDWKTPVGEGSKVNTAMV